MSEPSAPSEPNVDLRASQWGWKVIIGIAITDRKQ
jgi:hypothetical protein